VRLKIVPCDGISLRATKNRFPSPEIRSVRTIFRSVRAVCRSVRPKTRPCGDFPICARKKPVFDRFTEIRWS
jgi:hypothetical protein